MDSRISTIDKIAILYRTGIKFLRGGVRRIFLKDIFAVERMLSLKISLRFMGCVLMAWISEIM